MFNPVTSQLNVPELEAEVLAHWKQRDIFRRSVEERPEDNLYVFYEGPPTANGEPGIHHVLSRVFKDAIPRYRTMRGYRVPRKGGWDTHGLPVELEVEKELGLRSKPEIEAYGVEAFNRKCKESVFKYVEAWERMTDRIGFWVDMEDAYVTYDNRYIETGWWILKQLWDQGLIFQDYRSTPHCPRCGTSLSSHELALGYQEDTPDPSVFIKFHVPAANLPASGPLAADGPPLYLVAWTTTPWTLPGNTALAVAEGAEYSVVQVERDGQPERLVLATALVERAVRDEHAVLGTVKGADLKGLVYEPLYDPTAWGIEVRAFDESGMLRRPSELEQMPVRRVISAEYVSLEDGTGIVHIAPAFGGEDYEAGKRDGLIFALTVDLRGQIMGNGPFSGKFVKTADPEVIVDLRNRGLLLRAETIKHTYPFCWRCETPLLYIAKPSWYIRTSKLKDRLTGNNERINWYPEHIKEGRFGDWLANNIDWAVSRERYWGTPLPFWVCPDCGFQHCIGSIEDLRAQAVDKAKAAALNDLHRPYVDDIAIRCNGCGGAARRVPEVADAWFDSGAMPYAQWHYPFENKELFEQRFPADFICEAIDQTRGWFYTLHAESTLLNAVEAVPSGISFKNCIVLGHILDAQGNKMSKSRGNRVDPWTVLDRYGADPLRWYLFTASPAGQPRRFNMDQIGEVHRRFFLTLWNTYSFFVTYANLDGWTPDAADGERSDLDRWVLSELNLLVQRVTAEMEGYNPTEAGRAIGEFVDDLSNWYVRRSRRRFWKSESDADKLAAYRTLHTCLVTVAKLLAPLTPFIADALYRNLTDGQQGEFDSVHLAQWPAVNEALIDRDLSESTRLVQRVSSLGRAARAKGKVRVRQPLGEVLVAVRTPEEAESLQRLAAQVTEELNVKRLTIVENPGDLMEFQIRPNLPVLGPRLGKALGGLQKALAGMDAAHVAADVWAGRSVQAGEHALDPGDLLVTTRERPKEGYAGASELGYTVMLDLTISNDLAAEGLAREVVHTVQSLRRDAGFEIADRIVLRYQGDDALAGVMSTYGDYIRAETLTTTLEPGAPDEGMASVSESLDGHEVTLAVRRV